MILKQPEGKLFLSGEGLSDKYNGYIHGGYCEGLATADLILHEQGIVPAQSSLPPCP